MSDPRGPTPHPRSGALPAVRLRPTVSNRGGPAAAFGWAAAGAITLSAAWFAFSLFRPLPEESGVEPARIPPDVTVIPRSASLLERDRVLAQLDGGNAFAFKRLAWSGGTAVAGSPDGDAETDGGTAPAVALSPEQTVPADIKPAYDNIRLVAVFESAGKPGMLISFIQGDDPAKSQLFRVKDTFTDKAHPTPQWKVLAINLAQKSVVLERNGKQVELRMYRNVPESRPSVAARPAPTDPAAAPVVVHQTRAEILLKLREAKISEADIAALMAQLGPEPAEAPIGLAAATRADKSKPAAPEPEILVPSDAPGGLEEVLKMMAQRRAPGSTQNPPPAPPHAPPPDKAPTPIPANPK